MKSREARAAFERDAERRIERHHRIILMQIISGMDETAHLSGVRYC